MPHKVTSTNIGVFALLFLLGGCATKNDVFVGKFASETRENFGSDNYGEFVFEIEKRGESYNVALFHKGVQMWARQATECEIKEEDYLRYRSPGEARVLCITLESKSRFAVFSYSENGTTISTSHFRKHHSTKYYGRVQWLIYGFRKVE